jgi:site-specific DNA-methyltransferase (cytosine-N4-specific)
VTPFVADGDFTLHVGDALEVLQALPDESVHCVVTSPPYWGLRDYGTGSWAGGDPACDHLRQSDVSRQSSTLVGSTDTQGGTIAWKNSCGKCGATRTDQQLGLEPTPDAYITRMVQVFREVRRVLRRDGTCWLNIGDSYNAYNGNRGLSGSTLEGSDRPEARPRFPSGHGLSAGGLKPKDLVGIPWRLAFALQADGWYLRSDIIWAKPNPMPESVTDRPTKAHEYVFLLTREARYFYDADAIREPAEYGYCPTTNGDAWQSIGASDRNPLRGGKTVKLGDGTGGRNARSVWAIATQPYAEAHFATFPEELPRRCIAAGCAEDGVVLDPFMGSGTVALVARRLGRKSIGIELNPEYAELCARRLQQQSLFACVVDESAGMKDTVG